MTRSEELPDPPSSQARGHSTAAAWLAVSRIASSVRCSSVELDRGQKPATQLALELGVNRNQLYKWQEQLREHGSAGAFRGPGAKPLKERSEIERLKHELAKVTEERDILKKAAAYFAKELP